MNDVINPIAQVVLSLPESPPLDLDMVEVSFDDRLDELVRLELAVHSPDPALVVDDVLGKPLQLEVPTPAGAIRVTTLVSGVRQESSEPTGLSRYRLHAVSPMWLTTRRIQSRIFQDVSVIDIVHQVLAEYGGRIPPVHEVLSKSYPKHEYVAQYGETDWGFLRRILADEGILLLASHDGSGAATLVDDLTSLDLQAEETIAFRGDSELRAAGPHVRRARFATDLVTSVATWRDFDFTRPRLQLEHRALDVSRAIEDGLEHFGYGVGHFGDDAGGRAVSALRLEQARRESSRAELETNFVMAVGTRFGLREHPRADANSDWVVVRSHHHVTAEAAQHRLTVVPLGQPQRPELLPKPRIIGTQTAFVVGAGDGEEIDVDTHGRVLVRFHWDRRDKQSSTSRRVRVSQAWAGPGYGLTCLPRVGDEVVVEFLDGDPDQPLVVGRVHNGVNLHPRPLPADKAVSTWRSRSTPGGEGFNEIALEDAAGNERIFVRAQRDLVAHVLNDAHIQVDGHVFSNVLGNTSGGVVGNGNLSIDGDVKVGIGGTLSVDAAQITETAKGSLALVAGGTRVDESSTHVINTGSLSARAGIVQFVTPTFHVSSGNITLVAGGSAISITDGGIEIRSSGPVTINGSVISLN